MTGGDTEFKTAAVKALQCSKANPLEVNERVRSLRIEKKY